MSSSHLFTTNDMSDLNQTPMNHSRLSSIVALFLFMWIGHGQVIGQTIALKDTCICTENPLRALDTILITSMSSMPVYVDSYSPKLSPNQVLYYEPFGSPFYLSWQTPELDTLPLVDTLAGPLYVFKYAGYRVSSQAFDSLTFAQLGGATITTALGACIPPDAALAATDSICLNDLSMYQFSIPDSILKSSVWTLSGTTKAGESFTGLTGSGTIFTPMTGSGINVSFTGSGFSMMYPQSAMNNGNSISIQFGQPGNYTLNIEGATSKMCFFEDMIDIYVQDNNYSIEGFHELCAGDTVMFNFPSDATYDSLSWSISDTNVASIIGMADQNSVMIAIDDSMVMRTTDLIMYARSSIGANCEIFDTLTLTVSSDLAAIIASTDSSRLGLVADTLVCLGDLREFGINVFNTDSVTWTSLTGKSSFPGGFTMMDTVSIQFDSVGIDTIVVEGTTVMGCTFSDSLILRIQGTDVMIIGNVDVCAGDTAGYRAMYADGTAAEFMSINWTVLADSTEVDTFLSMSSMGTQNDSLTGIWYGRGNYDIIVSGMTMAGCMLEDTFTVNVIDTSFTIVGPILACVGAPATFALVQSVDSMDVLMAPDSVTWTVSIGSPTKINGTFEELTDMDFNDSLIHNFQTSTFDKPFDYFVVATGMANGCSFSDTLQVTVVGDASDDELAILGPADLQMQCAGADDVIFRLGIPDSIINGPVTWSVTQLSTGAPLAPASLDDSRIDSLLVTFPNLADTFVVRAIGELGGQCPFDITLNVVLTDSIGIINSAALDSTCLTQDSQVYVINVDTSMLSLADIQVTITDVSNGTVISPLLTNSGSRIAAYTTWQEAGKYILRFRGNIDSTGCDIDESLCVTVKDTAYVINGDFQICSGDTMQYVLLQGWDNMPVQDFPSMDSINWVFDPAAVDTSYVTGAIGDTLTIVWTGVSGKYELAVMDSTLCCPIVVTDSVLVRVPGTFDLQGPASVCLDDVAGYVIKNFDGSYIDDLVADSTMWEVKNGNAIAADSDSLTVRFDLPGTFTSAMDTIYFKGLTNDGCVVLDTFYVEVRSNQAILLGPTAVCQGDSVDLRLVYASDSSLIMGLSTVQWVFTPGDTLLGTDTLMNFIDSMGMTEFTWTEQGSFTVTALGFIGDSCAITTSTVVNVSTLPEDGIEGDLNTCVNSFDTYMLDIAMTDVDSIKWTVMPYAGSPADGATITGGQGTTEIEITWSDTGEYFIEVMGATVGGCEFYYKQDIKIISAANIGQLACNNDINVTLANSCELMLTPDMILEHPDPTIPDEQYEITVIEEISGVKLSSGLVDVSLLGVKLKVEIVHECSGQTCWGYITLEDKNIPELICGTDTLECDASIDPRFLDFGPLRRLGYPVPSDITNITQTNNNPPTYKVVGYEKCGDATLTYEDRIEEEICIGEFGTIIYRDWTMKNVSGLSSTCTDTIYLKRVDIDSIDLSVLPVKLTFDCSISESNLQPGNLTGDLNLSMAQYCFNIQTQFVDTRDSGCSDKVFTLNRQWTIFDWCDGTVITHRQTIQVVDTIGPSITLRTGPILLEATLHSCTGEYDLTPDITITDNCSDLKSVTVRIFEFDEHNPPGTLLYNITDGNYTGLTFDHSVTKVTIEVTAMDECGRTNEKTVMRDIQVTDNVKPIPVCDENTTVSLGSNGWAVATYHAFDDKSFDNCGIEKICVTRMDHVDIFEGLVPSNRDYVNWTTFMTAVDGAQGEFGPLSTIYEDATEIISGTEVIRRDSLCRPYIKFNCLDAMDTTALLVRLTVYDLAGNSNICMVNTTIQDNSPVVSDTLVGDITISCTEDITKYVMNSDDVVQFRSGTCGIPRSLEDYSASVDTNSCGVGTIIRNWRFTDDFNNTVQHRQTITIGFDSEKFDPAILATVWPPDYIGEGCAGPGTAPENLDAIYSPNLDLDQYPCSSLALDYQDLVFYNVEGYCAKILRTWTLIDWCNRGSNNQLIEYTHVQLLKVNDTDDPVITTGCQNETFTVTNRSNCSAFVSTGATATDCHAAEDLSWTYVIKDDTGTTQGAGNTNTINSNLDMGSYEITWIVADRCGNQDSCIKTITVVDGVAPVIECRSKTLSLGANGTIDVLASEMVATAADNCSAGGDLTYAFQSGSGSAMQTFDCDDLAGQAFRDFTLQVFVSDAAGNTSSCSVTLTLNDNNNTCQTTMGRASIAGAIYTEADFTIDKAQVAVQRMASGDEVSMRTPLEGDYAFAELSMFENYEVTATRQDAYLNGVSTLDLVMIQQHILGLRSLSTAYKLIAADVDDSGSVSATDLVHLRKLILGRSLDLPIGQSWTFVDASQTWANNQKPFPYDQKIVIDALDDDMTGLDFIGVKMGDVNGNVELQSALLGITRSTEAIEVEEIERIGEEVIIGLTPSTSSPIMGLQMALSFDIRETQLLGIISDVIDITEDNYSIVDGEIRISWHASSAIEMTEGLPLFELVLRTSSTDNTEGILAISEELMTAEIYKTAGDKIEVSDLHLDHKKIEAAGEDMMEVMQNMPNPWQQSTTISFYQPQSGPMTMKVYDLTGKEIIQVTDNYEKGWQRTTLNKDQMPGTGVYVYEMTDGVSVIRKKMIIVE